MVLHTTVWENFFVGVIWFMRPTSSMVACRVLAKQKSSRRESLLLGGGVWGYLPTQFGVLESTRIICRIAGEKAGGYETKLGENP